MESGQWTDQKFEWTPFQSLRCHLREHESRGENHQRLNAQVAMQSKTTKEHRHTQTAAECESKNASELLRMEQKDWIEEMR